jgi:1-acyl-sn-glycerol-3-phosphate acyltransferase
MISNHLSSLDFLAKMAVVLRMGFSGGNILTIMKKSVKYIPVIGWTPYLQGGLLLNRNWNEDKDPLTEKFKQLNDPEEYPQPYLFGMYPEGTRKTVEKLADAQLFEESRGLPILHNVLCPRTKGFVCVVQHLRQSCKRIIDLTIAYEPNALNILDVFFKPGFQTRRIYIHVDVLEMSQLPEEEKELEQWLYKQFQKKDEWLSNQKRNYVEEDMSQSYRSSIPLNTWFYPFVGFHLFFVYMLKVLFGGWIGNVAAMVIIYSYLSLTTQINDWLRNMLIRWLSSKEQHLINLIKLD